MRALFGSCLRTASAAIAQPPPSQVTTARRAGHKVASSTVLGTLAFGSWAAGPADELRARHAALADELAHNAFQRPIHLESSQTSGDLKGEVHAIVEHPFATLENALKSADQWCDILILHLNVKHCRASGGPPANALADQEVPVGGRTENDRLAQGADGVMFMNDAGHSGRDRSSSKKTGERRRRRQRFNTE